MQTLEFPPIAADDIWAPTAPMAWSDDTEASAEVSACPWGFEMLGADCEIEHADGRRVDGKLLQWNPANNRCLFQSQPDYAELTWSLSRLRVVTLTRVQPAGSGLASGDLGGDGLRVQTLAYSIDLVCGKRLSGVSLGHVERPEGHYLSRRVGTAGASVRLFVSRQAVAKASFQGVEGQTGPGPVATPGQIARFEPVRTVDQLREAVAAQSNMPVLRIGDVLVSLGLLGVEQLAKALSQGGDLPLGERLLRSGLVSHEGLQRALHMKMGYPVIDVRRFPIDKALLRRLPYERAVELQMLAVARIGDAIVAVMADPGRIKALEQLKFALGARIIPALPWTDPVDVALKEAYGVRGIGGSDVGWFG